MRANRRIETDLSYSWTSRSSKLIEQIGLFDTTTFAFLLLVFFASASGISVIRATHDYRHLFISLQEAREHSNQLGVIWGQLLIEQSTFGRRRSRFGVRKKGTAATPCGLFGFEQSP